MLLFAFYPYRADGSATGFETYELADDAEAMRRARGVLQEHRSSIEVVVWQGERRVGAVTRAHHPA
ncbi:MAG: hypothetical protein JF588_18670 [Caulobacterales bacterium]|nr:hypothetical protein [Caulobacterales bacterium]